MSYVIKLGNSIEHVIESSVDMDTIIDLVDKLNEDNEEVMSSYTWTEAEDWTESGINSYLAEPEKEYTIPLAVIKKVCGWGKFCRVTVTNELCLSVQNETSCFTIKESHAKELELI